MGSSGSHVSIIRAFFSGGDPSFSGIATLVYLSPRLAISGARMVLMRYRVLGGRGGGKMTTTRVSGGSLLGYGRSRVLVIGDL